MSNQSDPTVDHAASAAGYDATASHHEATESHAETAHDGQHGSGFFYDPGQAQHHHQQQNVHHGYAYNMGTPALQHYNTHGHAWGTTPYAPPQFFASATPNTTSGYSFQPAQNYPQQQWAANNQYAAPPPPPQYHTPQQYSQPQQQSPYPAAQPGEMATMRAELARLRIELAAAKQAHTAPAPPTPAATNRAASCGFGCGGMTLPDLTGLAGASCGSCQHAHPHVHSGLPSQPPLPLPNGATYHGINSAATNGALPGFLPTLPHLQPPQQQSPSAATVNAATAVSRLEIKPLDSETSKSLRESGGSLDLDKIETFIPRFVNRVSTRHRAVRALLGLTPEQWRAMAVQPPSTVYGDFTVADLHVANQWVADAFLNILDHSHDRPDNFEKNLTPDEMISGMDILTKARALAPGNGTTTAEGLLDVEDEFDSFNPLMPGDTPEKTERNCKLIFAKWKLTDAYATRQIKPTAQRKMILKKMPTTTEALRDKKEKWMTQLLEAEIMYKTDPAKLLEAPWSYDQLVELIGLTLKRAAAPAANWARDGPPAGGAPFDACLSCGKKHAGKCTGKCVTEKKANCCPCIHAGANKCPFKSSDKLLHSNCTNASGKKVTKDIFLKLRGAHKARFPDTYASANAATDEPPPKSDDKEEKPDASASDVLATAVASNTGGPKLHASVATVGSPSGSPSGSRFSNLEHEGDDTGVYDDDTGALLTEEQVAALDREVRARHVARRAGPAQVEAPSSEEEFQMDADGYAIAPDYVYLAAAAGMNPRPRSRRNRRVLTRPSSPSSALEAGRTPGASRHARLRAAREREAEHDARASTTEADTIAALDEIIARGAPPRPSGIDRASRAAAGVRREGSARAGANTGGSTVRDTVRKLLACTGRATSHPDPTVYGSESNYAVLGSESNPQPVIGSESNATCLPACAAAGAAASMTVRFMVDGGSNANFTFDQRLRRACTFTPAPGTIGGIAGGLAYTGVAQTAATFGTECISMAMLYTPHGNRNILSESVLLDEYGIETFKPRAAPAYLEFPNGHAVPLVRAGGVWHVDVRFATTPPPPASARRAVTAHAADVSAAEASTADAQLTQIAAAAARADDSGLLWAARLDVDADTLVKTARALRGVPVDSLSAKQREAIASNTHRAIGQAKNAPTSSTPPRDRATRPAETLVCDGFGTHHAASPIDGAKYQFHAIDEYSSFGYVASGKTHTIDDWVTFLKGVVLDARAHGHNPTRVRFDRAPELRADELKTRLKKECDLIVELTPRAHHEGVGRAERNNDLLTRMAECMLQRAQLGTQWLLPARAYAQYILNRRIVRGETETRYQRFYRKVPDLTSRIPYTFGTTVSVVEDVRGPKGSLDHARGSIGTFVGIDDASYLVWRPQRGNVVHQHAVRPLNELALIRSGLPAAVATVNAETQTPSAGWQSLVKLGTSAPPAAAPRPPPARPPTVDLPISTRIEVLWPQRGSKEPVWYSGVIIESIDQLNGRRRHYVAYDGWPESQWYWHDLACDDHQWRRAPETTATAPTAALPGPVTRLRARAAAASALEQVDAALEHCSSYEATECFNAAVYQALGDDGAGLECRHWRELPAAYAALANAAHHDRPLPACTAAAVACCTTAIEVPIFCLSRDGAASCCKASQNTVDVETPMGTRQYTVPSSYKQLLASEQRDKWLAAEQKALDAILSRPGNRLVSRAVPAALGLPVAPCVTQRRLKIDPHTKAIESFKARHCVDGGRHQALLTRAGASTEVETSSSVADDLLIKMLLSDAAQRKRNLLKADVPDAYTKGERIGRPKTYMHLPTAFSWMRADDGSELCIELTTPMWGEAPAGFEWQVELERELIRIGWERAENVPACWRYKSADGDALLVTIVDDLLFSESSSSGYSIAERTCKLLSEKYGDVKAQRDPTSFAGFRVTRAAGGSLQLTMPQKIIEAVREHMPELLDGEPLPLPKGKHLQTLADSLALPVERPKQLKRHQRRTQQLIGSLKFIERLHPRLSLILHRLSCVMSCPPVEAYDVARAALAMAHDERDVGLTFGGAGMRTEPRLEGKINAEIDLEDSAPIWLESHADATWGDRNVYGLILTFGGAAVHHTTKKIALTVDSSMETEAIGTSKAGETVSYAREILRAFGTPPDGPTLISTDNKANQSQAAGTSHPSRSKHFLRRYNALVDRVRRGEVVIKHVPDANMPADFLTKWIPNTKLNTSVLYATGARLSSAAAPSV